MTEQSISPQSISPLRRRMIEDMTIRGFAAGTQRAYLRAVMDLTAFLGHAPDRAQAEDLRRYQLHMRWHCQSNANRSPKRMQPGHSGHKSMPLGQRR